MFYGEITLPTYQSYESELSWRFKSGWGSQPLQCCAMIKRLRIYKLKLSTFLMNFRSQIMCTTHALEGTWITLYRLFEIIKYSTKATNNCPSSSWNGENISSMFWAAAACTQTSSRELCRAAKSPRSEVTVNYGTWLGFVSGITAFSIWKVSFISEDAENFSCSRWLSFGHKHEATQKPTFVQLRTSSIIKRWESKKSI